VILRPIAFIAGRAAGIGGFNLLESETRQIQVIHEHIQEPDRIIFGYIILDGIRYKGKLVPIDTFYVFHYSPFNLVVGFHLPV
jgi:hypothetical protein